MNQRVGQHAPSADDAKPRKVADTPNGCAAIQRQSGDLGRRESNEVRQNEMHIFLEKFLWRNNVMYQ